MAEMAKAEQKSKANADAKMKLKAQKDARAKLEAVMKQDGKWEPLPVPVKERCRCYCKGDGCRLLTKQQRRCSLANAARQAPLCPKFKHIHLCESCWATDFRSAPPSWQQLLNLQRA